jgi:Fe-S oxidoreductase
MLKQKIQNIKDSGAEVVAVGCPACMIQLGGGLDKQAPEIKVKHVAEILAEDLAPEPTPEPKKKTKPAPAKDEFHFH